MGIARYLSKLASGLSSDGIVPASKGGTGNTSGGGGGSGSGGPKVSSIIVTDSSYTNLDDTAVDIAGGYIKIIGSGFETGCQVLIGTTPVISVTFVSATEIRAQVPATTAGTYILYVVNTDGGTALRVNGITFSTTPAWTSTSPITGAVNSQISIQLTATGASTFSVAAGSTLPTGLTLSSNGLLSGIIANITESTVYNFTILATDSELQDSPKTFALNISAAKDPYFKDTALLLPGADTTFVDDASTNNFAVTITGDTKPNSFNPYTPGYYSNYFDGTGDYLQKVAPPTYLCDWTSTDFTIEYWVNATAFGSGVNGGSNVIGNVNDAGDGEYWSFGPISTGAVRFYYYNGGQNSLTTSTTLSANKWYHLAFVNTSGTLKIYINGVLSATGTKAGTPQFGSAVAFTIGSGTGSAFNGYLSNLRIVQSAVYTTDFTPPTSPLTAISGTQLLTCQSNRVIDNSTNNVAFTVYGNTSIKSFDPFTPNSSYSIYGSGYFDGTGDYIKAPANAAFSFDADFCIECWVNTSTISLDPYGRRLWSFGSGAGTYLDATFYDGGAITSNLCIQVPSAGIVIVGTIPVANSQWNHVALTRSGSSMKLFVNGVQSGSTYTTAGAYTAGATNGMYIGCLGEGVGGFLSGFVTNLRVVKGTAVYTTAFTPPSAPLTAIANTSLLTLQNNQSVNNSVFLDNSTNSFLVTRAGNTTQGTFSPYGNNWSNYFDGTGDYLTFPNNSNMPFGTGSFTIEFWINAPLNNDKFILGGRSAIGGTLHITTGGSASTAGVLRYVGSSTILSSNVITDNTWHHCAIVRNGSSNITLYVDGISVATGTDTTNYTATTGTWVIGANDFSYPANVGSNNFNGYFSNLRIVKGTAVYTSDFTPPTTPLVTVSGTQLLTCAGNNIVDYSPNNFTITKNGDVSVQRFSPFSPASVTPTSYSGYFDGTGDYLSAAGTNLALSTGDFTIECWFYRMQSGRVDGIYTAGRSPSASGGFGIKVNNDNKIYWNTNTSYGGPGSATINANQWYHIAITRQSGTLKWYINGTLDFTGAGFTQDCTNQFALFGITDDPTYTNMYISNARIIKGTALYTTSFTPSTTPLTTTSQGATASQVSLLTLQSNTLIDNSIYNYPITAYGDTKPSIQNPFGYTSTTTNGYTPSTVGGSAYFDGSGDYLSLSSDNAFNLSTAPWTVDGWAYMTGGSGYRTIISRRSGTYAKWEIGIDPSNLLYFYESSVLSGSTAITNNSWFHFAACYDGTTFRMFLNGLIVYSASGNKAASGTDPLYIGGTYPAGGQLMTGYLSNIRVIRGQALYTSPFIPPTSPSSAVQNTVLLNNFTNAAIYDASMINNLETVGDAKLSTAVSKFGGSSMSFDGTGDYLVCPDSPNQEFGAGNLTWEMWINTTNSTQYATLYSRTPAAFTTGMWSLMMNMASATTGDVGLYVGDYSNASPLLQTTGVSIRDGNWHHIAVVRNGTAWALYVDGTSRATATWSGTIADIAYGAYISADQYYGRAFTGYIDDLRITKGYARYTANFTPPAIANYIK